MRSSAAIRVPPHRPVGLSTSTEVPLGSVHLHVQRMHDIRTPTQVKAAMGLAQAGVAVEVGVLPI